MTFGGEPVGNAPLASTQTDTPDSEPAVPATGWHVVVTHPITGRRLVPDILDSPTKLPSINSLPEIRVPVRKSETWLDPDLDDDPAMAVYLDGERQPIDELRQIEDRTDRTVLVGRGGLELEQRVRAEFTLEQRHLAARDLVTSNTSYSEDVDTPAVDSLDDQRLQEPDSQVELQDLINIADSDPLEIDSNGNVNLLQTCWVPQPADIAFSGNATIVTGDEYEEGQGYELPDRTDSDGNRTQISFEVTIGHDIPETDSGLPDFRPAVRAKMDGPDNGEVGVEIKDSSGSSLGAVARGIGDETLSWEDLTTNNTISDVPSGTYTIEVYRRDSEADNMLVDLAIVRDRGSRFSPTFSYTFDNTLNTAGGYLDGPELYPDTYTVEAADALSAFSITGANASLTIDDTTGGQSLQVSNDRGQNWYPSNGTEDNTSSVDVTFPDFGATLRLRFDLSRYSPNGAQDETPRLGYDGQSVDSWTLDADLDLAPLLVDYTADDDLASILTDIAGEEFNWSVNLDSNGDYQVSWTQPGARTAGYNPDIGGVTVSKDRDVYEKVAIKGSNRNITGETWEASLTFGPLDESVNEAIVAGSETVYDGTTTYDRSVDYEMNYSDGEIRATDAGSLAIGTDYSADYAVEVVGSYTVAGAGSNPREFVEQVPQVSSEAGAESIAYILATEFSVPRYSADLSIPQSETTFDPLDALTLENLDLPDEATPLEPREQPEITPEGIQVRLGTRGRLQQALSSLAERLQQVSRRS